MNDDIEAEDINHENTEQRENASTETAQQTEKAQANETQQTSEQTQNAYHQPPIYNEPTPNYYYPNAVDEPKKVRRVGTLTMGLALIVTGVVAIVGLINPNFNFVFFAKFSPLILVFLGIEILIGSFAGKNTKLKYDFLSGFVCFMLICASISVIILVPIAQHYGFRDYDSNRISAELDNIYVASLSGLPVSSLGTEVYINGYVDDTSKLTIDSLRPQDHVRVTIQVLGNFTDKAAFAAQCKPILDKIIPLGTRHKEIYLHSIPNADKGTIYSVRLDDSLSAVISVENLALMVDDGKMDDEHLRLQEKEEQMQTRQEEAEQRLQSRTEQLEEQHQSKQEELQSKTEQLEEQYQSKHEELQSKTEELEEKYQIRTAELEERYQSRQEALQSRAN